jgi:hypothetical protein
VVQVQQRSQSAVRRQALAALHTQPAERGRTVAQRMAEQLHNSAEEDTAEHIAGRLRQGRQRPLAEEDIGYLDY